MGMMYGDGQGPAPGPAQMQPQSWHPYEFSAHENQTIAKAATWTKALAIVLFVQTGINTIQQILQMNICGAIIGAGIALAIGIPFLQAGQSLTHVVRTEGDDINHMMAAIAKLGTAFLVRIIVVSIVLGLVLLAVLALIVLLPRAMC